MFVFREVAVERTRLKAPDAMDLHRFFAPECDLSLGNWAAADVEKERVSPRTRVVNENMAETERLGAASGRG